MNYKKNDLVRVWDGSHNRDASKGIRRNGIDKLFKNHTATVIETQLPTNLDLLLEFDDKKKTRVFVKSSCCCLPSEYKERGGVGGFLRRTYGRT